MSARRRLRQLLTDASSRPPKPPPEAWTQTTPTEVCWPLAGGGGVVDHTRPWRPTPPDDGLPESDDRLGGVWDANRVRDFLADAMETLRGCCGDGPRRWRSSMPEVVREWEAYGWAAAEAARARPDGAALDDLDRALELMFALSPRERRIVTAFAAGLSSRKAAALVKCSHTQALIEHRAILAKLAALLNGAS